MNYPLLQSIEKLQAKIDLSKLCSCQLVELAIAVVSIDPLGKELILGFIYLESLIQGIIFSHDHQNYLDYLNAIGNRKITMIYHGSAELQFRMMLKIPEYSPTFSQITLNENVCSLAKEMLSPWLRVYSKRFGIEAVARIKQGLQSDPDIERLVKEFPFLKEPLSTTFGFKEVA